MRRIHQEVIASMSRVATQLFYARIHSSSGGYCSILVGRIYTAVRWFFDIAGSFRILMYIVTLIIFYSRASTLPNRRLASGEIMHNRHTHKHMYKWPDVSGGSPVWPTTCLSGILHKRRLDLAWCIYRYWFHKKKKGIEREERRGGKEDNILLLLRLCANVFLFVRNVTENGRTWEL